MAIAIKRLIWFHPCDIEKILTELHKSLAKGCRLTALMGDAIKLPLQH